MVIPGLSVRIFKINKVEVNCVIPGLSVGITVSKVSKLRLFKACLQEYAGYIRFVNCYSRPVCQDI